MSEEVEAGDWFVLPGSTEPQFALTKAGAVITYEDERGMTMTVPLASVKKAEDPFPKLRKLMNTPSAFEVPAEVQAVLDRAEQLLHPTPKLEGDWEWLHGMQEDLYAMSFQVLLDYPYYREQLLKKLIEVNAKRIPRW